jgi:hypothetical protein
MAFTVAEERISIVSLLIEVFVALLLNEAPTDVIVEMLVELPTVKTGAVAPAKYTLVSEAMFATPVTFSVLDRVAAPVTAIVLDRVAAPVTPTVLDKVAAPVTAIVLDRVAAPVTNNVPFVEIPVIETTELFVLFAIERVELFETEFTVELPTKIVVVLRITLAPTEICVWLATTLPATRPTEVIETFDVELTRAIADAFTVVFPEAFLTERVSVEMLAFAVPLLNEAPMLFTVEIDVLLPTLNNEVAAAAT